MSGRQMAPSSSGICARFGFGFNTLMRTFSKWFLGMTGDKYVNRTAYSTMQGWKLLLHHTESCIKSYIWRQHIHFNATNINILHTLLALHISASENLFNSAVFQMKRKELGIVLFTWSCLHNDCSSPEAQVLMGDSWTYKFNHSIMVNCFFSFGNSST